MRGQRRQLHVWEGPGRPKEHDLQIAVGGDALWFFYEDSAHMTGEVQRTIKIPNRLLLKWANVKDKNYIALPNTSIKDKIIKNLSTLKLTGTHG